MRTKLVLRVIKIIVSVSLIAVLIASVDWRDIFSHLDDFSPGPAMLAVLLLSVQYLVSAWKWQKSLKLHGVHYSFGYLLRILCIGFFFNNFLPSSVGGDAYRAYRTFPNASRPAYSISAIIVERAMGLMVLVLFGYLAAIYLVVRDELQFGRTLVALGAIGGILVVLAILGRHAGLVTRLTHKLGKVPKLEPLLESLRTIKKHKQHLPGLVGMSIVFQSFAIFAIALLFAALALPGKIVESGFTAAAAGVAGMIPISINGIGVVEGSFAVAATLANLPYGEAVVVALFIRFFGLVSSVLFGVLYIFERDANKQTDKGQTSKMDHLPHKARYLLQTTVSNPAELLRLVRVALISGWCRWIKRCTGKNTVVGEGAVLINSTNISIGANCLIKDRVYMRAGIDGRIVLEDGVALNSFAQFYGHGGIYIGRDSQVGPNVVVTTTGHDYLSAELESEYAEIRIGERVWIGANCTIIGGVTIGDHAVIGAGAVVVNDIPAHSLAVGVPARVVRKFDDRNDPVATNAAK